MIYLLDWSEFEDGEGFFFFYNFEYWMGNFCILVYKEDVVVFGGMNYGKDFVCQELKENFLVFLVKVGYLECVYSKEMFEEEGIYYISYFWVIGIDNVVFECLFIVLKGEYVDEVEKIIFSFEICKDG